ncbi:MAG: nitroreductase/quinone reductase family protein, partial [Rudaea sp.]
FGLLGEFVSSTLDPQQQLRKVFKRLNPSMVMFFRLGLGGWMNSPDVGGQIMVLTHTGRKTGAIRRTPLNYAIVDGEVYCMAGFGAISDWYRNIQKNPAVQVWLPDGWWCGTAEDVSDSPERLFLVRQVLIASGFAARLFGMDAYSMSDARVDEQTRISRLIHIKRTEACTGSGGPNDLAWIWPAVTFALLGLLFLRGKTLRRGRPSR